MARNFFVFNGRYEFRFQKVFIFIVPAPRHILAIINYALKDLKSYASQCMTSGSNSNRYLLSSS
jgi:hypothetical protein